MPSLATNGLSPLLHRKKTASDGTQEELNVTLPPGCTVMLFVAPAAAPKFMLITVSLTFWNAKYVRDALAIMSVCCPVVTKLERVVTPLRSITLPVDGLVLTFWFIGWLVLADGSSPSARLILL
jgi:hypothetical protein